MQKIEVYKKIAAIDSKEAMLDIQEELEDRFSNIPKPVDNLMNIAYIKALANKIGIQEVKEKPTEVIIKFASRDLINPNLVKTIINKYNRKIIFKLGEEPAIGYQLKDVKKEDLIGTLRELVEYLQTTIERK
jgi:transcription-repair coupling factor (superfamily II helicase)